MQSDTLLQEYILQIYNHDSATVSKDQEKVKLIDQGDRSDQVISSGSGY